MKTKWVGDEIDRPWRKGSEAVSQEDALAALREMGVCCPTADQIAKTHFRLIDEWVKAHPEVE